MSDMPNASKKPSAAPAARAAKRPVKAAALPRAAAKPVKAPAKAASRPAAKPAAKAAEPTKVLKLKELVESAAKAADVKKKTARAVIEATLAIIGQALGEGSDLNLPALGKGHVNRHRNQARAEVLMIKLKRAHPAPAGGKGAKAPLDPAKDKG